MNVAYIIEVLILIAHIFLSKSYDNYDGFLGHEGVLILICVVHCRTCCSIARTSGEIKVGFYPAFL